jgi:hypothetical protein
MCITFWLPWFTAVQRLLRTLLALSRDSLMCRQPCIGGQVSLLAASKACSFLLRSTKLSAAALTLSAVARIACRGGSTTAVHSANHVVSW